MTIDIPNFAVGSFASVDFEDTNKSIYIKKNCFEVPRLTSCKGNYVKLY